MKKKQFIYILILLIFFLFGCNSNNYSINKTHTLYNDTIDPYFIIKGTPHNILNFQGDKELINSYNISINIQSLLDEEIDNVNFEVNTINYINEHSLVYQNYDKHGDRTPIIKTIANNINVGGNGFKQIYGKVNYTHQEEVNKSFDFYENILLIIDDKISEDSYIDSQESELVNIRISFQEEEDYYNTEFTISLLKDEKHHFDFQSWLMTPSGGVFPFTGLYNYYLNTNHISLSDNLIYKDIDFLYMYFRCVYWNEDGHPTEILKKYEIIDLLINDN